MSGQKTILYDERIPFTAIDIYAEMKKQPQGTKLTFNQICKMFNNVKEDDIRKCMAFLVRNSMVILNNRTLTYTVNENKNIRIFKG